MLLFISPGKSRHIDYTTLFLEQSLISQVPRGRRSESVVWCCRFSRTTAAESDDDDNDVGGNDNGDDDGDDGHDAEAATAATERRR